MHGDLRREVLAILERVGSDKGVRYAEVAKALNEQSSIPIEASELTSVIKVSFVYC
jgi:DNA replication licensing factor MCM4